MIASVQIDAERIDAALDAAVRSDAVPGVVGFVADADGVLYQRAFGRHRAGDERPLAPDAVFRIASMSKLATSVAALRLVDAGRLDLDAAVGDYLPEFDRLKVLIGFDSDGRPHVRPPRTRATVRQLCAHVSGLGYDTWHPQLLQYLQTTGLPTISMGLRETFRAPLVADPGSEFNYGTSTDWLGLVIEERAGQPLAQYMAESLFTPLGMRDTAFVPTAEQRERSVPLHVHPDGDDRRWTAIDFEFPEAPEFHAGGHGLYSTAADYGRLQRALLRGGELDGVRVLSEEIVAAMFVPQTEHRVDGIPTAIPAASADVHIIDGQRWGLAFPLTETAQPGMRSAGAGGWAGLWNTFFWIDPASGLTAGLYTLTMPFCDPGVVATFEAFERAVYAGEPARAATSS